MKLCLFLSLLTVAVTMANAYTIEGRVYAPSEKDLTKIKVVLDDGSHRGFVRADGRFAIHNVARGSYVAQAVSSTLVFEPLRVEISAKGNMRARQLNNLRPSAVVIHKYPLEFKAIGQPRYFQKREQFNVLDMMKNPMVLMMVLPILILAVLPKMVNSQDPEVRKEMEESMKMFNPGQNQLPDMSDVFTKWFGNENPNSRRIKSGSASSAVARGSKTAKRR